MGLDRSDFGERLRMALVFQDRAIQSAYRDAIREVEREELRQLLADLAEGAHTQQCRTRDLLARVERDRSPTEA